MKDSEKVPSSIHGKINGDGSHDIFQSIIKYRKILHENKIKIIVAAFFSLLIGVGLIVLRDHFKTELLEHHLLDEIMHDVAIGFIVGSAVGICYDGLAKLDAKAMGEFEFVENFKTLKMAQSGFDQLTNQLIESMDPEFSIKNRLSEIFPDKKYKPFAESVMSLIHETREIRKLEGKIKTKEISDYVEMLNWLIREYAVENATQFKLLLSALQSRGSAAFTHPDRRTAMLHLLSAQMKSMKKNDRYDSLTNMWLYNDESKNYLALTGKALQKGVVIRRIFNVSNAWASRRGTDDFDRQMNAIRLQIDWLSSLGKFECKYLTCDTLAELDEGLLNDVGISEREGVKELFFGNFYHVAEKQLVRFEPDRVEITKMAMAVYPLESDSEQIHNFKKLFDHIWEKSHTESPTVALNSIDALSDISG